MYCSKCGTRNKEDALFCTACGMKVADNVVPEADAGATINAAKTAALDHSQNKSANFDPSQIHISIDFLGKKEYISQEEISLADAFIVQITNNSHQDIKWLGFEIAVTKKYGHRKLVLEDVIRNGNTQNAYRLETCLETTVERVNYGGKLATPAIPKKSSYKHEYTFKDSGDLKHDIKSVKLYRIYGELGTGDKFQELRHPKLAFDSNGLVKLNTDKILVPATIASIFIGAVAAYFIRKGGSDAAIINETWPVAMMIGGLIGGVSWFAAGKYVSILERIIRFFPGIMAGAILGGFGAFIANFIIGFN